MMVVKRARSFAKTSGLLCRCNVARETSSDGSIRILASLAPISRITIEARYRCQNLATANQYFSSSAMPNCSNCAGEILRSEARKIKSRSSRANPLVVRAACKSSGHSRYPSMISPASNSLMKLSCSGPLKRIGSGSLLSVFIFKIEKASE